MILPSLVPIGLSKWRYNIFDLSRDLKRPRNKETMQIHRLELLPACHHPDKFGDHMHCDKDI